MNTFTFRPAPPVDGEYAGDLEDLHRLLQHDDELAHDDRLEEHHSACPRTCPRKGFQRALQRIRRRSDGEEATGKKMEKEMEREVPSYTRCQYTPP